MQQRRYRRQPAPACHSDLCPVCLTALRGWTRCRLFMQKKSSPPERARPAAWILHVCGDRLAVIESMINNIGTSPRVRGSVTLRGRRGMRCTALTRGGALRCDQIDRIDGLRLYSTTFYIPVNGAAGAAQASRPGASRDSRRTTAPSAGVPADTGRSCTPP